MTKPKNPETNRPGSYANAILSEADNSYLSGEAVLPERIPLENQRRAKRLRNYRRGSGLEHLALWMGPAAHQPFPFPTKAAACKAWHEHGERLMQSLASGGQRPWGFWMFELGWHPPDLDEQPAILHELGLLSLTEEQQLLPQWRDAYRHACGLRGLAAVRDFLDKAALPMSLFRKFNAEKRRVAAQIRVLAAVNRVEIGERTQSPR